MGFSGSRPKKSSSSFLVVPAPSDTRKVISLSGGSFLLREKSLPGFTAYSEIEETVLSTADNRTGLSKIVEYT